jgi:hypothetical protein
MRLNTRVAVYLGRELLGVAAPIQMLESPGSSRILKLLGLLLADFIEIYKQAGPPCTSRSVDEVIRDKITRPGGHT